MSEQRQLTSMEILYGRGSGAQPDRIREDLLKRVEQIAGYRPTVGLFGKTGAGKSKLGNALFGRDDLAVSDVLAGTREPKPLAAALFGVDITLIDLPGFGENATRDDEYRAMYVEWLPKIDVALWLIKMDDRVLAPDLKLFEEVVKPSGFPVDRIVFTISQLDKGEPMDDWDSIHGRPGLKLQQNVDKKVAHIQAEFQVPEHQIVAVSAVRTYNLKSIAETIVDVSSAEAALNLARSLESELRTEIVRDTVISRIWGSIKEFYVSNQDKIHHLLVDVIGGILKKQLRL